MPPPSPTRLMSCPHCHFAFHPRAACMTLDCCPRCLARRHVAQSLRGSDVSVNDTATVTRGTRLRRPGTGRSARWGTAARLDE